MLFKRIKRSELLTKLIEWRRNPSKKSLVDGASRRGKSESEGQLLFTNIENYMIKPQWNPANPANVNSMTSNEEIKIWEDPSHHLDVVNSFEDDYNTTAIIVPSLSVHKPKSVETLVYFKKNKQESNSNPVPLDVNPYSKDDITDGSKSNPVLFQQEIDEEIKSTSEEMKKWGSPCQYTEVKVHPVVDHMISMAGKNNRLMIKTLKVYGSLVN
jgi:hypothetical protein